jgi:hypothetical protein
MAVTVAEGQNEQINESGFSESISRIKNISELYKNLDIDIFKGNSKSIQNVML